MYDKETQIVELKYTHGDDVVYHKFNIDGMHLDSAIQAYLNFLRGIGYVISDDEDRV